jgi:hypothetical protein
MHHYCPIDLRVASDFNGNGIVETKLFHFNPTKLIKSWRTAWRSLTKIDSKRKERIGSSGFEPLTPTVSR